MSFTATDVINRARLVWSEVVASDILSPENCLRWISDGVLELRSIRPESTRFDTGLNPVEFSDITDPGAAIQLDDKFRPVLTDYLIARGFQGNANLQNHEGRANNHFKLFYDRARVV